MLVIPHIVKPSAIHGNGVFATELIRKGTVVWYFDKFLDRKINKRDVMTTQVMDFLDHYGYVNKDYPDSVILCFDHARYMNFGIPANTEMSQPIINEEHSLRAVRDIQAGEEITVPLDSDHEALLKLKISHE